jgi:hypothetical protein
MKKQIKDFCEFHEWGIQSFDYRQQTVNLNLEDMESINGENERVGLKFESVSGFTVEGVKHERWTTQTSKSETVDVLTLKIDNNKAVLIAEWFNHLNHKSIIQCIEFEFEKVVCESM